MSNVLTFVRRLFRTSSDRASRRIKFLVHEQALEFFNSLSATLEIELTRPAQPVGGLLNVAAPPNAQLVALRLEKEVFDEESETGRPLTQAELEMVVFQASAIWLRSESGQVIAHEAPEDMRFTIRALLDAVEETERRTRGTSQWLRGIDVHHIYFEGIHQTEEGIWNISWGS